MTEATADSQICTNLTIAQKSAIFSGLHHIFYYLSRVLISPLSSHALFISTLDKGGRSQTSPEEKEVSVWCIGVKEGPFSSVGPFKTEHSVVMIGLRSALCLLLFKLEGEHTKLVCAHGAYSLSPVSVRLYESQHSVSCSTLIPHSIQDDTPVTIPRLYMDWLCLLYELHY